MLAFPSAALSFLLTAPTYRPGSFSLQDKSSGVMSFIAGLIWTEPLAEVRNIIN